MKLFLDSDGVLMDFNANAVPYLGMHDREYVARYGEEALQEKIRAYPGGFYRTLPLLPDARALFDAVKHLHPTILTGVPRGGWAEAQKVGAAAEHFPGTPIITCRPKDKRLHMQPGDILIDDSLKYRHLWIEAGGIYVHHTSAADSIRQLQEMGML